MRSEAKVGTTLLGAIKNVIKAINEAKGEVINNKDDIYDWNECINKINEFSEEDRDAIKRIMDADKAMKKRKEMAKNMRENLESQVKIPERRPNIKAKVVNKKENKELVE